MNSEYPRRKSRAFLLMDDADDSSGDGYFWNMFFKDDIIWRRNSCYRVVVFCSYSSTSRPGDSCTRGTAADWGSGPLQSTAITEFDLFRRFDRGGSRITE